MDRGVSGGVFREHNLLDPFGAIQTFLATCPRRARSREPGSRPYVDADDGGFSLHSNARSSKDDRSRDILETYTEPERYSETTLAENPPAVEYVAGFRLRRLRLPRPKRRSS